MNHSYKLRSLLQKACLYKASDIHITIRKTNIEIEFRTIDAQLIKSELHLSSAFIQYLKIKAHIDLLSSLKPQTGQFEIKIAEQVLSIRMAYLKNKQMESIVLRILNTQRHFEIKELFDYKDMIKMQNLLHKKAGLILISGTTGSGKTTTLYACLDYLMDLKIYSIEDPIEILKEHVVQVQINKLADFSFDEAIKQILRHDPNVIVIGEIRSSEEALAALTCSLSGHLVISTIHSSSAEITLKRLIDLGCDKEVLYDSILAIIHQDLLYDPHKDERKAKYHIIERNTIHQLMDR